MSGQNPFLGQIPSELSGKPIVDPTTTKPCTKNYNTIVMKEGDTFVLPPGATVISSTAGGSALQSDCAVLALETPECYIVPISLAADRKGDYTEVWTNDRTTITGISVGGTFYSFNFASGSYIDGVGCINFSGVANFIGNHPVLRNILTCPGSATGGNSDRGCTSTFCFKAIPSIGKTITIRVDTGHESPSAGSYAFFPARPVADYTGGGKCGCAC